MWLLSAMLGVAAVFCFIGTARGIWELANDCPDGSPPMRTLRATIFCATMAIGFAYLSGLAWRA